jgi:hypothetical protein
MINFLKEIYERLKLLPFHSLKKQTRLLEDQIALLSLKVYTLEKYASDQGLLISQLAHTQNDLATSQNDLVALMISPIPSDLSVLESSAYDKISFLAFDDDDDLIN